MIKIIIRGIIGGILLFILGVPPGSLQLFIGVFLISILTDPAIWGKKKEEDKQ